MKPALIDTDILSLFFRNDLAVIEHFREYLQEYGRIEIFVNAGELIEKFRLF